jgi:hypothetical protein
MRIIFAALISAIVGTAVGGSLAYLQVYQVANVAPRSIVQQPEPGDQSVPQVVVDKPEHDFGQMQRGTTKSHEFKFRNTGTAPLMLQAGASSCKCTLSEVPDDAIPPGGSANVKLEWRTLVPTGPFRQTAEIKTNDPNHPRVMLTVSGEVTEASGVWPPDVVFGQVRYGEEKSADVFVMSNYDPELEVSDPMFSDPDASQYLTIEIQPVDRAELPNRSAKAGVRVRLTTKPNMPLGRFDQWVSLKTNMRDADKLEIPITGRVIGSVNIYGRNWNEEQGILRLGTVKSSEGTKGELHIVARDEVAADVTAGVTFEVVSSDPPELKVTIGKPNRLSDELVSTPVTIEVPAGTPPMVRLGTSQGDEGRVVLRSTLPDAPKLTINVRFAVQR